MALTNYQPGPLENMMGTIIGARFVPTPIPIKGTDYTNKIIVSPLDLKMFHRDCESRLHCTREASYLDRTHPGGVELKCAVNDQTRKKSFASERAKLEQNQGFYCFPGYLLHLTMQRRFFSIHFFLGHRNACLPTGKKDLLFIHFQGLKSGIHI